MEESPITSDSNYYELPENKLAYQHVNTHEDATGTAVHHFRQKRVAFMLATFAICVLTYYVMLLQSFMAMDPSSENFDKMAPLKDDSNYYESIDFSAKDKELKNQLQKLVSKHVAIPYEKVWDAFSDIYKHDSCDTDPNHIPDVYSAFCWSPKKDVLHGECGSYKVEGDCFNREHIWPKSWFGGFEHGQGAQTDLFELAPSDGKVNAKRGDLPLGAVDSNKISYTSTNGCRVGKCSSKLYSGDCFEVADMHKGDFARVYFYLSVTYQGQWSCCNEAGVDGSSIKPWMEQELRIWHVKDPVDESERAKNDAIFTRWQYNRNPFIDYPKLVDQISDF